MKAFPEGTRIPGRRLPMLLLAALLLAASLVNPSLPLPRDTFSFIFVLDITGSMNVADAGPAGSGLRRLAFAKQLVRETLEELPCGARAGLGIFTEHRSFLLFAPIEICENHLVISTMLDRIDRRMAWAELSEVAKGLYSGIEAVGTLGAMQEQDTDPTHLVFMTDGHEAPPVHPALRPKFDGEPGEVGGLVAGIGGTVPVPIPYLDENDQVIGYWAQDEVLQVDRHSLGRPATQRGEAMAGIDGSNVRERIASGTEHLSSLREDYLQRLAAETGLDYVRATTGETFAGVLSDSRYATRQSIVTNVAWIPAGLSLFCLVVLFGARPLRRGAMVGGFAEISGRPGRRGPGRVRVAAAPRRSSPHR